MDFSAVAPQSCCAASDILSLPIYGIDPDVCGRLRITPHSDHGTISDVIRTYGSGLGYDVQTDCLVAGHRSGSAPSHGAGGSSAPRPSARARCDAAQTQRDSARSMAMDVRYGDQCVHDEGPQTIWRALSPAFSWPSEPIQAAGSPSRPTMAGSSPARRLSTASPRASSPGWIRFLLSPLLLPTGHPRPPQSFLRPSAFLGHPFPSAQA